MNRVVFDIETLAYPFESFDPEQQAYLLKFAHSDEERAEAIQRLSLTPFTACVVAIAMVNPDSHQGKVFYDSPERKSGYSDDGLVEFCPCNEEEMLREFWKTIARYPQFVTFNGRSFDCPFLLLRSATLGIKPSRNLMPYRYNWSEHCDLMEQLTFYGAMRKFSLDFYCKSFGIKSPKENGITGLEIGKLHAEGRFKEIAEYCLGDVRATTELFHRWVENLGFER
jgi:3'-5' exonuclease